MSDRNTDTSNVNYEIQGDVAVIEIDRDEKRNAIDRDTSEELTRIIHRFNDDDEAEIGVLCGAGNHFSAGADLEKMDLVDKPEGYLGFTRIHVDKPTIAAVEGYCVAGGLEMAIWCDIRVAASDAVFGCYERRYGVPLVDGGTQRLPRIVGLGRALEMIMMGRSVEAEEAYNWGLVNEVVENGDAVEQAVEIGERIASYPMETVLSDRAAVYDGLGSSLEEGLKMEAWYGSRVLDTAREGAERFREE